MEDPERGKRAMIEEARISLARAFELLTREDTFGAALELQKVRSFLKSLSGSLPEENVEVFHDWGMLDPYTAQCRLCGKRRALGVEERTLLPVAF